MKKKFALVLNFLFWSGAAIAFAQAPMYSALDLSTLGGNYSYATGVNDLGQVTGTSTTSTGANHAFLYSNGVMQDLGTLNGGFGAGSTAYSVNNSGQVVGSGFLGQPGTGVAFLYSNGSMQPLPGLGSSQAYCINDVGQIAGQSNMFGTQGFLYYGGSAHSLGSIGGSVSSGYAVNNLGQVTGYALNSKNQLHAFLSFDGEMTDLGTVGASYDRNTGYGINNLGQVTGSLASSTGAPQHAFLYSDTMHDLGTLKGASGSFGIGISDAGLIVGNAQMLSGLDHGFLYFDGAMYDLNDLVSPSFGLTDIALNFQGDPINELGQIAAYGTTADGERHALLLSPVPEPSIFALLLGSGIVGLIVRHRKSIG